MKTKKNKSIIIKGAKVNNLKNIDVEIPSNKLVVITGVSGSGKTSLAFDTLFAEGQRRYVESLSTYARQFLGRMNKPEVDSIYNIAPAIAVEQRTANRNPRSTVGTITEIYEYIKLLYAKIGRTLSPFSGKEVIRHSVSNVVDAVLDLNEGERVTVICPVTLRKDETLTGRLELLMQLGYVRIYYQNSIVKIEDFLQENKNKIPLNLAVSLMIDRLSVKKNDEETYLRLSDSVHTAFNEGEGYCDVIIGESNFGEKNHLHFSNRFEADGMTFTKPSENFFSFNNPYGACQCCNGSGQVEGISEELVITNPSLSLYDDCINCWRGEIMQKFKLDFIAKNHTTFPIHKPYNKLTEEQKHFLWYGDKNTVGIYSFFDMLRKDKYKIQNRVMLARYTGKTTCHECSGTRLRKDASYVKIDGKSIVDLVLMPVDELATFFDTIELTSHEWEVARRIVDEIKVRITYLCDVGLSYLTLNRQSSTLSGGESQRISLATSLGSPLIGSMYILDEPTIGLHSRDTQRLLHVLCALRDVGNSVIVVEHDKQIIENADYIIDIGPAAGRNGGEIVFAGTFEELLKSDKSLTAKYLRTKYFASDLSQNTRKWKEYLQIKNANEHNLKDVTFTLPLGIKTTICGVSGSGKTTLVKTVFYNAVKLLLNQNVETIPKCSKITGSTQLIQAVEMVSQDPIGRSSRSNPATYLGIFDDIRSLFANQPMARQRKLTAGYFSFNSEAGGRCKHCKGEGTITVPMQFMADVILPCEHCNGTRYEAEALEVKYKGKSISDVLDITVDEAKEFFSNGKPDADGRIIQKLNCLIDVGLGYLKLGQSSSTLSGGEAQRIKLAFYLSKGKTGQNTLFIFDEPTTGLHFADIEKLNKSFDALIAMGHTILVIEHNADLIRTADWIVELGPEGGKQGGEIIFEGTPQALLVHRPLTHTAEFLLQ
ncbi:MAG: excinuclease ABC subunit UvrA [Bacteroidales bacterium]|jgi:excinuclease ABC subunit A|nr:excinuclease ABC subunit UvrA [Bacteroidales bacterium]